MENIFHNGELGYGPDLLKPGSKQSSRFGNAYGISTFIYTKYGFKGKHFFVEPSTVGHEHLATQPEVIQAMFGPELDKLKPQIAYQRTIYKDEPDPVTGGMKAVPTGSVEDWNHWEVRAKALNTNLFGRYGRVNNHSVIMLWNNPENWQFMLAHTIQELNAPKDTVITVGTEVIGTAETFRSSVDQSPEQQQRMQLLARYHTAIGDEKSDLKKQLGFDKVEIPDNNKRPHWRRAGREAGLNLFSYGEGFSDWLHNEEELL